MSENENDSEKYFKEQINHMGTRITAVEIGIATILGKIDSLLVQKNDKEVKIQEETIPTTKAVENSKNEEEEKEEEEDDEEDKSTDSSINNSFNISADNINTMPRNSNRGTSNNNNSTSNNNNSTSNNNNSTNINQHGTCIEQVNILLDTGAISDNYMSEVFYDKHINILRNNTTAIQTQVILGDSTTSIPINKRVAIALTLCTQQHTKSEAYDIHCNVMPSRNDIIIGLPFLLGQGYAFFSQVLKEQQGVVVDNDAQPYNQHVSNLLVNLSSVVDIHLTPEPPPDHTFFQTEAEEAPEEIEIPPSCSFTEVLNYMEETEEEALETYASLFDTHIDAQFLKDQPVKQLLQTKGKKVFVPHNWEGIKGIEIDIKFKEQPPRQKARIRPINPKLFDNCKQEIERLKKYHLVTSTSEVASALVIAPKATPPYIRICANYPPINKYMEVGHQPIPHVQYSLEKIARFKVFVDLDMTNSFHQFKLSTRTSELLSIVTPFGQYRPLFMPEGIAPATGILQQHVTRIFNDFSEWSIILFDNFLILAYDYEDAYIKLDKFLDKCIEYNIYLKFSKSYIGYNEVNFFGYICNNNTYRLSIKRIESINQIPFPSSKRQMQCFLGSALFFKSFVPHYSTISAPLNEMTHASFNWKAQSSWNVDYIASYNKLKEAITNAVGLHYPDYNLEWILRTDASEVGIGGVLLQLTTDGTLQPIQFISKKFSPQACRWATIEQECYGIYYCIHALDYYLRCKSFILETDHRNLLWLEKSIVPKILRWTIYIRSFNLQIRHIPGKCNTVADWLSRAHTNIPEEQAPVLHNIESTTTMNSLLSQVHGGRAGHRGIKRTYEALNLHHPGHGISINQITDYIANCPICQKDRVLQRQHHLQQQPT